jgi:hypothetical protein
MAYTWTGEEQLSADNIRLRYKKVMRGLVVPQVLEYYNAGYIDDLTAGQISEIGDYAMSLPIDHILALGYYELIEEWKSYQTGDSA